MADDRFPYNLPGRQALVRLINETYPSYRLDVAYTDFKPPFFSPTIQTPGRTFIQAENTEINADFWFVFRRLDLGILFPQNVEILVDGVITPRKIVEEINRSYDMSFDEEDVLMSNTQLVPLGHSAFYRMRSKAGSFVWYGSALIEVGPLHPPENARTLEDGVTFRFLENGDLREMES